ncbi:uncharacterized protein LOC34619417 [Cyclospora cayetanensis]|uniref:Uncharacterized protein LOC34619417 n=1 Tax=Cyclospora cayetanensis TaxID=88456 RepID=A0A6P6RZ02_9EIME|nr:uncharacterized protein LOC34619417 [Cyclospora cayetanensis]
MGMRAAIVPNSECEAASLRQPNCAWPSRAIVSGTQLEVRASGHSYSLPLDFSLKHGSKLSFPLNKCNTVLRGQLQRTESAQILASALPRRDVRVRYVEVLFFILSVYFACISLYIYANMEAVRLHDDAEQHSDGSSGPIPSKATRAADSITSAEEAGQSTVCCSSEDEYPSAENYASDDERQDSDDQRRTHPTPAAAEPQQQPLHAALLEQQPLLQISQPSGVPSAPYAYTISSLDDIAPSEAPTAWLKPRIKIDGPEVFHGLLRANDESLPATESVPSTETFVSFQGQWRVVTSAGTSSYIGPTMNPWDPSTAAYPLPITYKVSDEEVVVREANNYISRADARHGILERIRRFFCTSIAEYMQS